MGRVEILKNNFVFLVEILRRTTTVDYKKLKGLLIYNPKTIICEAQAIKAEKKYFQIRRKSKRLFKRKRA